MTDSEARRQAFRTSAELLVGFRRIFRRGLLRLHGADWSDTAIPPAVRSRLDRRRDTELEVERTGASADEPIDYTTFADLAEILDSDKALAAMLSGLSSAPDGLIGNLRTLEDVRRKVAGARPLSDSESVVLAEIHLRMRQKLAGAKRRVQVGGSEPDTVEQAAPGVDHDGRGGEQSEPEIDRDRAAAADGKDAVADGGDAGDATDSVTAASETIAAVEVRTVRRAAPRAGEFFDGAKTPVGLVHVKPEDLQILRDLRLEIIAAAEAAYGYSDASSTKIWSELWESGWFEDKLEAYGLGDVLTFYAVMESYRDRHVRGDNRESLRTYLADRELAKLLLRLRELFDRLRI